MSHADFNLQIYWVYVYSGAKLVGLLQIRDKNHPCKNMDVRIVALDETEYLIMKSD